MSSKIKLVLGVVVVAVVAVVAVVLLTGGDQKRSSGSKNGGSAKSGGGSGSGSASSSGSGSGGGSGSASGLHTVAVKRGEGKAAVAQAGAVINDPKQIWVRASAAPKQSVRVNWSLACGAKSTSMDSYDVTPPDLRRLTLPRKNAKTCVASVSGQLSGSGRLKVAVLSGG